MKPGGLDGQARGYGEDADGAQSRGRYVHVRQEAIATRYGLPPNIGLTFVRLAHFIMQRKQLLGIASRAESRQRIGDHAIPTEAA